MCYHYYQKCSCSLELHCRDLGVYRDVSAQWALKCITGSLVVMKQHSKYILQLLTRSVAGSTPPQQQLLSVVLVH